ncbi:hypothetical protein [Thiothrix unzii]|jgi:phage shock protein PspC (stress-responsive transcriptional regulator)|nr:hypothetical protein [Thiothrix unzii]MDX9988652.1 hypothetical protein [Thiothrix unzii]
MKPKTITLTEKQLARHSISTFIAGVCTGLALYRLLQLLGVLI